MTGNYSSEKQIILLIESFTGKLKVNSAGEKVSKALAGEARFRGRT